MKSLGKRSVLSETFRDGKFVNKIQEQRTVYVDSSNDYWVNWLRSKRRVVKQLDGSFYWRMDITMIRGHTLDDILGGRNLPEEAK